MSAQDFGAALKRCRGAVSLSTLSGCMFSRAGFAPAPVGSAADLEKRLHSIEAGNLWPFDLTDLLAFTDAVVLCLRPALPTSKETGWRVSAALYYAELCNGP